MTPNNFFEIFPLKTETLPPFTTTNAVLYGKNSFVVIDPGSSDLREKQSLVQYLKSRIAHRQKFLAILLTHHHKDHVSSAAYIAQQFAVPVMAHERACAYLSFSLDKFIFDDEKIVIDEALTLYAIHTPGHAEDHLVFFDKENKVLIAGDMITDRGTVLIPPHTGSLKVYLESLEMLTRLPIKMIIPAHGKIITDQPVIFLLRGMKHRYERIISVLNVLVKNKHALDATDIMHLVYSSSIPDNLLVFAQLSVEANLQWLENAGVIKKINYKWQVLKNITYMKEEVLCGPLKEINERMRNS
jgi:endoribonuclease LACTB2